MTYFETLIKDARREADDSEYGTANLLRDLAVSLEVMVAESESLRKQLDGMTVERSMRYRHSIASGDDAVTPVQRLVGPWVEVE